MPNPLINCPLTGYVAKSSIVNNDHFHYFINVNNYNHSINLSLNDGWANEVLVKPEYKHIFLAMFFNKEWPIETEAIITPDLIEQIIRFGEYPKIFREKLDYYLLTTYLEGGKEYKRINHNVDGRYRAYANSSEEFERIIAGLSSKGYINVEPNISNSSFTFAEKGIEKAEELLSIKNNNEPKKFLSLTGRPKVAIYGVEEDSLYYEKLRKLFLDYGFTVSGEKVDSHTRVDFQNSQDNYVVFLQSDNSNKNTNYIALVSAASTIHNASAEKNSFNYLFFAFINNGNNYNETPSYVVDYLEVFYDFRIITNRKNLIRHVLRDWDKRAKFKAPNQQSLDNNLSSSRPYNFPQIEISEIHKSWLKIIYERFIKNTEEHFDNFFSMYWNDERFSKNFNPMDVNPLLLNSGSFITLYGIWSIYPTSKYIKGAEDLIKAIKSILEEKGRPHEITMVLLKTKLQYEAEEIGSFAELIHRFGGFFDRFQSSRPGMDFTIQIQNRDKLDKFKSFKTIEEAFEKQYGKEFSKGENDTGDKTDENTVKKTDFLNNRINKEGINAYKTLHGIRDINEIEGVMGVKELAIDIANLTHNLKNEKGQMIGIFGKWGRGKTFLLKELWDELNKNKEPEYIKIEYHAWKYQEAPASWAHLYENFSEKYLGDWETRYFKRFWLNIYRFGPWPVIIFLSAIFTSVIIPFSFEKLFPIVKTLTGIPQLGILFSYITIAATVFWRIHKEFGTKAIDLIKKYNIKHSYKEKMGIQADIQDELITLLKVWIPEKKVGKRKIILIVEDIDRCTEEKIIQNIDALRVLLEEEEIAKRVIIISAIDERILKNAIKIKYKSLLKNLEEPSENAKDKITDINELISEYLDKVFISAIKLGELTVSQKGEYLKELLKKEISKETFKEVDRIKKDKWKENHKSKMTSVSNDIKERMEIPDELVDIFASSRIEEDLFNQAGEKSADLAIENGDFVIKDGDFATEDFNGNPVSQLDIESKLNTRIANQKPIKELTPIEVYLFEGIVNKWGNTTPRKIRIFYYRYMLCKNILIGKYQLVGEKGRVCPWQSETGIKILMSEIFKYTILHNPSEISILKRKLILSEDNMTTIGQNEDEIEVIREDYILLLNTLELIIAY